MPLLNLVLLLARGNESRLILSPRIPRNLKNNASGLRTPGVGTTDEGLCDVVTALMFSYLSSEEDEEEDLLICRSG